VDTDAEVDVTFGRPTSIGFGKSRLRLQGAFDSIDGTAEFCEYAVPAVLAIRPL
jgi:hypothetical protein